MDLEVPGELVEAADVPEDHVPIAAKVEGQQVIMAEPDEELSCELSHSLGHRRQAALQHLVQVVIGVLLRVQERVCLAILLGQGVLARGRGADWLRGSALGEASESYLHKGELNSGDPCESCEGIGTAVHGKRLDPGKGTGYSALWLQAYPTSPPALLPPHLPQLTPLHPSCDC